MQDNTVCLNVRLVTAWLDQIEHSNEPDCLSVSRLLAVDCCIKEVHWWLTAPLRFCFVLLMGMWTLSLQDGLWMGRISHWAISVVCSVLSFMKCSISFHCGKGDVYVWDDGLSANHSWHVVNTEMSLRMGFLSLLWSIFTAIGQSLQPLSCLRLRHLFLFSDSYSQYS